MQNRKFENLIGLNPPTTLFEPKTFLCTLNDNINKNLICQQNKETIPLT